MKVRIVTDSTSDLPDEIARELGISVVPCYVNFGTESYLDKVDITRDEFYNRLSEVDRPPTTAAPPSGLFAECFEAILSESSGIICLHPPDRLSALRQSAIKGWELLRSKVPFSAIDSGQTSMGLGWIAIRAAKAAAAGESIESVVQMIDDLKHRVELFAALHSFDYLRMSGRVSWAQGTIGQFLRIRPILHLKEGNIDNAGLVRSTNKALQQLVRRFDSIKQIQDLAIIHSNAPELAQRLIDAIKYHSPEAIITANLTPALTCHVGPGAFGFVAIT
ncbi:MAG: DegV family protein [Chloroflexota bacterium]